jgi:hypothetical protein
LDYEKIDSIEAIILGEVQLLLAEKRTSLAAMRTGFYAAVLFYWAPI